MENSIEEMIKASLDGVKCFTETDTVIGNAINTPSGVTVIPVSKIKLGFAGGGFDLSGKKNAPSQGFGTGSGSGISITPIAFLTVSNNADVNLIYINESSSAGLQKIASLVEKTPEILQKIKNTFT